MSNKKKIIAIVVVLVLIAAGAIIWFTTKSANHEVKIQGGGFEVKLKPNMVTSLERDIPSEVRPNFEENLAKAKELVQNEPTFEHWIDLGVAKSALGDLWGAAEAYLKAYELGPTSSLPLDNLSQVLIEMGDYEIAERALLQAKENVSGNELIYLHLADLYKNYLKKSNQEIEAVYIEGFGKTSHINIVLALVNFYEEIGEKIKAEELREKIEKGLEAAPPVDVEFSEEPAGE